MDDVRIKFSCKSPHPRWLKQLTFKVGPNNGVTSSGRGMFGGVPLMEQKRRRKLTGLQQQEEEYQQRKRET